MIQKCIAIRQEFSADVLRRTSHHMHYATDDMFRKSRLLMAWNILRLRLRVRRIGNSFVVPARIFTVTYDRYDDTHSDAKDSTELVPSYLLLVHISLYLVHVPWYLFIPGTCTRTLVLVYTCTRTLVLLLVQVPSYSYPAIFAWYIHTCYQYLVITTVPTTPVASEPAHVFSFTHVGAWKSMFLRFYVFLQILAKTVFAHAITSLHSQQRSHASRQKDAFSSELDFFPKTSANETNFIARVCTQCCSSKPHTTSILVPRLLHT